MNKIKIYTIISRLEAGDEFEVVDMIVDEHLSVIVKCQNKGCFDIPMKFFRFNNLQPNGKFKIKKFIKQNEESIPILETI